MSFRDRIRARHHTFWRWYEILTAVIGWTAIPTMLLVFWNGFAPVLGWPEVLADQTAWLWGYLGAALTWIFKADIFKYRMTRDPRDHPGRKWWSFKHAQQFRPGERIFVERAGDLRPGSLVARCGTCHQVHGYPAEQAGTRQICGVYGCRAELDLSDPANYTIQN